MSSTCEGLQDFIDGRTNPVIGHSDGGILVSIIVVNQNGIHHLKTLIPALLMHTKGIEYELIVVDNASNDASIKYLEIYADSLHLKVIKNNTNKSFSYANNQAIESAEGKYLVLLNNDIEPLSGWLHYLIYSAESLHNCGAVGSRLLYPDIKLSRFRNPFKKKVKKACSVQHAGITFKNEGSQFRPYNLGAGKAWDDPSVLVSEEKVALTAACLLIPKEVYIDVGGLDEQYNYGGEDVDFGLRLLQAGYKNYYCSDSVLFHHEFGTQSREKKKQAAQRRKTNLKKFQAKWFLFIKKAYWEEKFYEKPSFYAESPLALLAMTKDKESILVNFLKPMEGHRWAVSSVEGNLANKHIVSDEVDVLLCNASYIDIKTLERQKKIVLSIGDNQGQEEDIIKTLKQRLLGVSIAIKIPAKTWENAHSWGDYHLAILLKQQFENIGYNVLLQILPEWDNDEGKACDVVIVLRGLSRYAIKRHQVNIMWNISHPDDVSLEEYQEYDKVFIASNFWAEVIAKQISTPVESMLQCTDMERFRRPMDIEKTKHSYQLLYIGNTRQVFRKAIKGILPTRYALAIYGKGWKKILPKEFESYVKGDHIPNDQLYKYYGSADILLNDHWDDMCSKGFVSNRIFDGLACGAFILTDKVKLMGDLEKYVRCYNSPKELNDFIDYYIDHPEEKLKNIQSGLKYVQENHTYEIRAKQFSNSIKKLLNSRLYT